MLSELRVKASNVCGDGSGGGGSWRGSHGPAETAVPGSAALTLLAVTSSSLSALSLYHVLALKAEVAVLRNEITRRREEQRSTPLRQEAGEPSQDREGAFRNTSSEPGTGPSGKLAIMYSKAC
ncbi:hypothetical protein JZ751_018393 [Albula glossodonta]|uniref:Uncharacterized protein n=1 Tax=Albula glossodonta TaxID=121402 RepID=A0A8T2MJZ8_9TELE|nr:hypothetical protein JZ751_018393 [Albula glossodonta]